MFRVISLFFVMILLLNVPAAAWNVPEADYNRDQCCFSQSCWNQKPSPNCSFTARGMPLWDSFSKEWRTYSDDGHIYLLQNGIRLLQEKGYDNWVAYLSDSDHFQALADGATWADTYKGRWVGRLYITAFFGAFKKQVGGNFDLCNMAGFDHYYSDFVTNPAGNGLEDVDEGQIATFITDELGGLITGIALNLVLTYIGSFIPVIGSLIQTLQATYMVGLSFEFSPSLDNTYPSTAVLADQRLNQAVDAYSSSNNPSVQYWYHRSAEYNSLFQAGWAAHYAQDVGVIYHLHDIWASFLNPHNAFEDDANGLGDPLIHPDYHVTENSWTIATTDSMPVMQIAQQGAIAVDDEVDWEMAKNDDSNIRREGLKNGVKVSEQMTAAILAQYLTRIEIPQKVPIFSGYVRDDATGTPVSGAYVFYREKLAFSGYPDAPGGIQTFIDQKKPWNYVRADLNGKYSLNLIGGRVYYIRAEHPAYQYRGYIDISTLEPMGQQITFAPVEFKQPLPGEAMSGIDYTLYLSSRGTGEETPSSPLLLEATLFPLDRNPTSATAKQLEQAVLIVRADTTALAALVPQEPYPLSLPNETYIDIEVANLINLENGEILTSTSQITSHLKDAGPKWMKYENALKTPERYQIATIFKTPDALAPLTPQQWEATDAMVQKPQWQFSISPNFNDSTDPLQFTETLKLTSGAVSPGIETAIDTGISPYVLEKLTDTIPKSQVLLPDNNLTDVYLLSYAFGQLPIIDSGQPLYENHLARIPSANAQIEVTLEQGSGLIGPEFNLFPSIKKPLQDEIYRVTPSAVMSLVNPQISPTPGPCPAGSTPIPDPQGNVVCIPVKTTSPSTVKQLTLHTNSEGRAAFLLKTGNQAGLIRLHIRIIDNPAASGIKPSETLEMVVHPPINWIESSIKTVVPPTLGSVAPRHSLQFLYALPAIDQQMTHVETGLCLNFSEGAGQTIQVNLLKCQPDPVIYRADLKAPSHIKGEPSLFTPLIGAWDFVISLPEKVGSLFLGKPEQAPIQEREDLSQICDDHNSCTINDRYVDGICRGDPISCIDRNPDTADSCDPVRGCTFTPLRAASEDTACDDGNFCTVNDRIIQGVCTGSPFNCDDGNPATVDTCEPTKGCIFTPLQTETISVTCNDRDPCTVNDRWVNGICWGDPLVCDDGNIETQDRCDPVSGCLFTPIVTITAEYIPCDDGNACTGNDRIIRDVCTGIPIVCDDGNPRTQDTCDPSSGCIFSRITTTTTTPSLVCPEGCTCMTPAEALQMYGHALRCLDTPCAADYSNPTMVQYKYCYRPAG